MTHNATKLFCYMFHFISFFIHWPYSSSAMNTLSRAHIGLKSLNHHRKLYVLSSSFFSYTKTFDFFSIYSFLLNTITYVYALGRALYICSIYLCVFGKHNTFFFLFLWLSQQARSKIWSIWKNKIGKYHCKSFSTTKTYNV